MGRKAKKESGDEEVLLFPPKELTAFQRKALTRKIKEFNRSIQDMGLRMSATLDTLIIVGWDNGDGTTTAMALSTNIRNGGEELFELTKDEILKGSTDGGPLHLNQGSKLQGRADGSPPGP